MQSRLSTYLEAARDLGFDRGNPKLEARGLAARLNTHRLRSVIKIWKRHLEITNKVHNAVTAPWNAFAALPADRFTAQAAESMRCRQRRRWGRFLDLPFTLWLRDRCLRAGRRRWTRWSSDTRRFFLSLRPAGKHAPGDVSVLARTARTRLGVATPCAFRARRTARGVGGRNARVSRSRPGRPT